MYQFALVRKHVRRVIPSARVHDTLGDVVEYYQSFLAVLDEWLPIQVGWGLIGRNGETEFHQVKHFSGSISNVEIDEIGNLVKKHCAC